MIGNIHFNTIYCRYGNIHFNAMQCLFGQGISLHFLWLWHVVWWKLRDFFAFIFFIIGWTYFFLILNVRTIFNATLYDWKHTFQYDILQISKHSFQRDSLQIWSGDFLFKNICNKYWQKNKIFLQNICNKNYSKDFIVLAWYIKDFFYNIIFTGYPK